LLMLGKTSNSNARFSMKI